MGSKVYRTNLEVLLIAHAAGRGGEHYLLRWDEAHWDPRFRVPDFEWPQQKQTDEQCMVFVMMLFAKEAFLLDLFWAFGAYFIAESGALNQSYHPAKTKYVFPELHGAQSKNTCSRLNKFLRKHSHLPKPLQSQYSTRSERKSSMTEMVAHSQLTPQQRLSRSGHSFHQNADVYSDDSPVTSLPGAMAITGRKNLSADVHPASIEWLDDASERTAVAFLNCIPVDVDELMFGGQMREFFVHCISAVLMYHPYVKEKYGETNLVVQRVESIAADVGIHDPDCPPGTPTSMVLQRWSERLQVCFEEYYP